MKKLKYVSLLLGLVMFFVLSSLSSGQTPSYDPGLPDTLLFEGVDYYLDGPPYEGKLKLPVVFFHDEGLAGVTAPFVWSGPIVLDSASFVGNRVEGDMETATIDSVNKKVLIIAAVITQDTIPSGRGLLTTLYFTISDTGYVEIDSTFIPPNFRFEFHWGAGAISWTPQFAKLQFHVTPTSAGDVNQDGSVGIVDVVFMINYLFKNGPAPPCSNCTDVNCDCEIGLVDVVYLINYLFRSGDPPQVGCVLPL
jgi:hypothetical protein